MTLDQALDQIMTYSVLYDLESLSAIEHMVKHFKTLAPEHREALTVFMDETKYVD